MRYLGPRTALAACKDRAELNQSGVYLLFGKDDDTDKGIVYVGQAGNRKNGEGILKTTPVQLKHVHLMRPFTLPSIRYILIFFISATPNYPPCYNNKLC